MGDPCRNGVTQDLKCDLPGSTLGYQEPEAAMIDESINADQNFIVKF
jgi:hypothetical protein